MSTELHPPDTHHLRAAIGWLELGNPSEAGEEVARISAQLLDNPDVLEVRWQICAAMQSWDTALGIAELQVAKAPTNATGWIHRAYSMRRARDGGLEKAWQALLPAVERFPDEALIPYNLACYAAQFGRLEEAWTWFQRAVVTGGETASIKRMALADSDLERLWERIRAL